MIPSGLAPIFSVTEEGNVLIIESVKYSSSRAKMREIYLLLRTHPKIVSVGTHHKAGTGEICVVQGEDSRYFIAIETQKKSTRKKFFGVLGEVFNDILYKMEPHRTNKRVFHT